MTILFDSELFDVNEVRNTKFYRKANRETVMAVAGDQSFLLYGFQDDFGLGTTVSGEGSGSDDITLSNAAMWTINGWYVGSTGGGWGILNDGGVSGYFGRIAASSTSSLLATTAITMAFKVNLTTVGEGGTGYLMFKDGAIAVRTTTVDEISVQIHNGAGWVEAITNDSPLEGGFGYWHDLLISIDLLVPGGVHIYWDGVDRTLAAVPALPAAFVDPGNPTYLLDNAANTAATSGVLGGVAIIHGLGAPAAFAAGMIELRGFFQMAGGNQPTLANYVQTEYGFNWATMLHFWTFQVLPLLTAKGTVLCWFRPTDFTNQQLLYGVNANPATIGSIGLQVRGDIANDPLEWYGRDAGGFVNNRLGHPLGLASYGSEQFSALTSDAVTVRAYLNGVRQTLAVTLGGNNGQWFSTPVGARIFEIGALRTSPILSEGYGGFMRKMVIFDRQLSDQEISDVAKAGLRALPQR